MGGRSLRRALNQSMSLHRGVHRSPRRGTRRRRQGNSQVGDTVLDRDTIAGTGTTYSAPTASAGTNNRALIAAEGPAHTLVVYSAVPGSAWTKVQADGANSTYPVPAVFVQADLEVDVTFQGPGSSLGYVHSENAGHFWYGDGEYQAPAGTIYSAPSIFVSSANSPNSTADIVALGADHTLQSYTAVPGSTRTNAVVAGAGTTFS